MIHQQKTDFSLKITAFSDDCLFFSSLTFRGFRMKIGAGGWGRLGSVAVVGSGVGDCKQWDQSSRGHGALAARTGLSLRIPSRLSSIKALRW